jgi:murein tripeptide amidase MpaA
MLHHNQGWLRRLVAAALLASGCANAETVHAPANDTGTSTLMSKADDSNALTTLAEQTSFIKTGRYAEVERLCEAYAKRWPQQVRCFEFGRSPEGRPMLALVATRSGALTAEEAHKRGLPVVLIQGGIHSGESDGKDAGFMVLREMLDKSGSSEALSKSVILFVPVLNLDGHERFGRWNRPNQVGPEEMGWRTTAQNLNLNRDYTKADAPEMQALLKLLDAWDPIVYADMHVTDGANFQHDVSVTVAPLHEGDALLHDAAAALQKNVIDRLTAQGSLPLPFYPSLVRTDDPSSGFAIDAYLPRYSTGYWAQRNRFAMLVETHSWKDYATRVRITRNIIVALEALAAHDGTTWLKLAQEADHRALALGGQDVTLAYEPGDHVSMIDFKGYAYTREPSPISGGLVTHYDPTTPQIWHVPLKDTLQPSLTIKAPKGGYIIPAAYADEIGARLALHGIVARRLDRAMAQAPLETFRASTAKLSAESFEGRSMLQLEGSWKNEARDVPAGSLFVPIAQAESRLVMTLLEPQAPDSFAAWGFFNGNFEQKEYMEPYVAEQVAQEMMAHDPKLAAEFRQKLDTDAAFAADPKARLDFFYRRHPSWDERYNLYPIYRVQQAPA